VIPRAQITAWRAVAPWATDAQVEQDLILSRALVQIFSNATLSACLTFRGGTALHKLFLNPPSRYSEDIDLVQVKPEPIGPTLTALHKTLDSWLGEPRRKQSEGRATLAYRFDSEIPPVTPLRLKVEINTREHFSAFGYVRKKFTVKNLWFDGKAELVTYSLEELLGTKLRALYQRKQGRDLFDRAAAFRKAPKLDPKRVVASFLKYIEREGLRISRAEFEANMAEKIEDAEFRSDIKPLLATSAFQGDAFNKGSFQTGHAEYDPDTAYRQVHKALIELLPGDPWKGTSTRA
jgi:predicted nucleotidyltransferase component of viral defense system